MEESAIIFRVNVIAKKDSLDHCKLSLKILKYIEIDSNFFIDARNPARLEMLIVKRFVDVKMEEFVMKIYKHVNVRPDGQEKFAPIDVSQDFLAPIAVKSVNALMELLAITCLVNAYVSQVSWDKNV